MNLALAPSALHQPMFGSEFDKNVPWNQNMWGGMNTYSSWANTAAGFAAVHAMAGYPYTGCENSWENFGPPLAVRVEGLSFHYQLTDDDVLKVFSRYGPVASVDVRQGGNLAYIQFMSIHHAFQAIQDLDGKTLSGLKGGRLRVSFHNGASTPSQQIPGTVGPGARWNSGLPGFWAPALEGMDGTPNSLASQNRKFTCKVEFDIENDKDFRVSSKVISVARRIWQELPNFQAKGGKTRLRGRGSGFLEGLEQKEADETLHLCISCRELNSFEEAINMAVKEIHNIQRDYVAYRTSKGLPAPKHLGCRVERQTRGMGPEEGEDSTGEKAATLNAFGMQNNMYGGSMGSTSVSGNSSVKSSKNKSGN